jgi:hypothetical protein
MPIARTPDTEPGAPEKPGTPLIRVVLCMAVLVLLIGAVSLVAMWWWVNAMPWSGQDKAKAHQDALQVTFNVVATGALLIALYVTARRQRTQELDHSQRERAHELAVRVAETNRLHAERVAAATERDAAARQVTEQFTNALELLASDKSVVRHGGLAALQRLGRENPDMRRTVLDVVCAYLRQPFDIAPNHTPNEATPDDAPSVTVLDRNQAEERLVRFAAQRVLTTSLRSDPDEVTGEPTNPDFWPGDYPIDLTGATLIDADFSECRFTAARFDECTFVGVAMLERATFAENAGFRDASFTAHVTFDEATFARGTFDRATFAQGASFEGVCFSEVASFHGATFAGDAWFDGTLFERGGWFRRVSFGFLAAFTTPPMCDMDLSESWCAADNSKDCVWPIGWTVDVAPDQRPGVDGVWTRLLKA